LLIFLPHPIATPLAIVRWPIAFIASVALADEFSSLCATERARALEK
jgi:hypothetical protein